MGTKYESVGSTAMSLQLGVLFRGPRLYSTRRLVEEAQAPKTSTSRSMIPQFSIRVGGHGGAIYYDGAPLDVDAVIPRIGHTITRHGTAVLRALEGVGCTQRTAVRDPPSRDKLRASQILARNRINVPTTVYVRDVLDVDQPSMPWGASLWSSNELRYPRSRRLPASYVPRDAQSRAGSSHRRQSRVDPIVHRRVAWKGHQSPGRRRPRGGIDAAKSSVGRNSFNYHLNGTVGVALPTDYALGTQRAARCWTEGLRRGSARGEGRAIGPRSEFIAGLEGIEAGRRASMSPGDHPIRPRSALQGHLPRQSDDHQQDTWHVDGLSETPSSSHRRSDLRMSSIRVTVNITALARDMRNLLEPRSIHAIRFNDVLLLHGNLEELRAALSIVLRPSRRTSLRRGTPRMPWADR